MSYPNTPYPNDPYGQGGQQPGQGGSGGYYPPPAPGYPQQGPTPGGPPAPYGGQQPGGYPPPPGAPQSGGYPAPGGYDQSQQPVGYPPPPGGQYGHPGGYGASSAYTGQPNQDERSTAVLTHIGGALTTWIIPLIIFATKKDESPFNRDQAVQALNFQLPLIIGYIISGILSIFLIGALIGLGIFIYSLVHAIKGASAVKQGEWYRYPYSANWVR
jgi:uncharacterized Tic20 family protein